MSDLVYYEKPALLDRDRHRRRRVLPSTSFAFARGANSLYVAGVEFAEAAREYAIVFTRPQGGRAVPVVMLGLRSRENLFVDAGGHWTARYVPAFVRRYPFVLAEMPGQAMAVCMDEAYPGLSETQGEALFDEQGRDTPFLQNALQFLGEYQREYTRTDAFCQRLEQAGLLTEMNARADLADGRSFTVSGLFVVDEKKLMALPDATALAMFRAGDLHLVSLHLASLSNMQGLVDKLARIGAPAPRPAPPPRD